MFSSFTLHTIQWLTHYEVIVKMKVNWAPGVPFFTHSSTQGKYVKLYFQPPSHGQQLHPKNLQGQKPVIFTKYDKQCLLKPYPYIHPPKHSQGHKPVEPYSKYFCSEKFIFQNIKLALSIDYRLRFFYIGS